MYPNALQYIYTCRRMKKGVKCKNNVSKMNEAASCLSVYIEDEGREGSLDG